MIQTNTFKIIRFKPKHPIASFEDVETRYELIIHDCVYPISSCTFHNTNGITIFDVSGTFFAGKDFTFNINIKTLENEVTIADVYVIRKN